MADTVIWESAFRLRDRIARGDLSSKALVSACLDRIDKLNPVLRAFVHVDREGALKAADLADQQVRDGAAVGPLHGLPIAVKDDLWVAGMPATTGSMIFANFVPTRDGTVVRRLREAGAIIIGKTNMPEFAAWPRTRSYVGGETVNPWDLSRIPGASSGGSAAAVASGMVPLAIGTDGGGSVRIPAALCGIVGLFPTIGRVPDYGGFLCSPISSCGPMARNVEDVALLQDVIAGPDIEVANSQMGAPPSLSDTYASGVAGMRVGWTPDHGHTPAEPGVIKAAERALAVLRDAGAIVETVGEHIPHPWGDHPIMAKAYEMARAWDKPDPKSFEGIPDTAFLEEELARCTGDASGFGSLPQMLTLLKQYAHLLSPSYQILMQSMRGDMSGTKPEIMQQVMDGIFARYDVLCSPTMAWVAPKIPSGWQTPYPDDYTGTNYTFIANAIGSPGVSVPCGLSEGLPVGFQVIGKRQDEAAVLRVASVIENALGTPGQPTGIRDALA